MYQIKQEILSEIEASVRKWCTHTAMQKRNHGPQHSGTLKHSHDTNLRNHEQGQGAEI